MRVLTKGRGAAHYLQVCEHIVIPNIRLRDDMEEMFEMNWVEYVRRDTEGSDNDTRRRAATDLVKALTARFEAQVRTQASSLSSTTADTPLFCFLKMPCRIPSTQQLCLWRAVSANQGAQPHPPAWMLLSQQTIAGRWYTPYTYVCAAAPTDVCSPLWSAGDQPVQRLCWRPAGRARRQSGAEMEGQGLRPVPGGGAGRARAHCRGGSHLHQPAGQHPGPLQPASAFQMSCFRDDHVLLAKAELARLVHQQSTYIQSSGHCILMQCIAIKSVILWC